MGGLIELGTIRGILKKSGAFYSYGETRLGQGRENSKEFLTQHPEIADSIESRIRDLAPTGDLPPPVDTNVDQEEAGFPVQTASQQEEAV